MSNKKKYKRKLSPSERYFLGFDTKKSTPVVIYLVVEGQGSFDLTAMQQAVSQAAKVNPNCHVRLKGVLGFSKWCETEDEPPISVLENPTPFSLNDAPWMNAYLPVTTGPVFDIVLVESNPKQIVFRVHHSVMDGRALVCLANDIFLALDGKQPIGSETRITAKDVLQSINAIKPEFNNNQVIPPTERTSAECNKVVMTHKYLAGTYSKLLPKVAISIAEHACQINEGTSVFQVLVDLRRHLEDKKTTGNLTSSFMLYVNANDSVEKVSRAIEIALEKNYEAWSSPLLRLASWIPIALFRKMIQLSYKYFVKSENILITGSISNLGVIPLHEFKGSGFVATSAYMLPPFTGVFAFNLMITGHEKGVEFVLQQPSCYAGPDGQSSIQLLDTIIERLQSTRT